MSIENTKNGVYAEMRANGSIVVGDHNTTSTTILNLKEAAEYKELQRELEELDKESCNLQTAIGLHPEIGYLKVRNLEISEKRNSITDKIEALIKEVLKLAEDFARIPINTERLQLAYQYFRQGEFSKARTILDAEEMRGELSETIKNEELGLLIIKQAKERRQKLANEFLILARLTAIDYSIPDRMERTNLIFQQSLKAERNIVNLFAYAKFLDDHKQIDPAILLYEELESLFRTIIHERKDFLIPAFADVLNNLGVLKLTKNEFESAIKYLEEAKKIQEKLAEIGMEFYKSSLALSTNNLAQLFEEQEKFDKAIELYNEAIALKKQVVENDDSSANQAAVADSLYDKAICIAKKVGKENTGEFEEAQSLFEEALTIQRKINTIEPKEFLSNLATILSNLGIIYSMQGKLDLAESSALEALELQKNLYQQNPFTYAQNYAGFLTNAALRFSEKNKFEEAEKFFIESLQIFQDLAQSNHQAYAMNVVNAAANFSSFYYDKMPNKEKSLQYAHLAIVNTIDLLERLPLANQITESTLRIVRNWDEDPQAFLIKCAMENERLKNS